MTLKVRTSTQVGEYEVVSIRPSNLTNVYKVKLWKDDEEYLIHETTLDERSSHWRRFLKP